jgi:hypothetical protein
MRLSLLIFAVSLALMSGCRSPSITESRIRIPSVSVTPEPLEAPKDGKILITISGNATEHGQVWVRADANLATIEDLFSCRPEWASHNIRIWRRDSASEKGLRCRVNKMNRAEKEKIKIYHGDFICFAFDRCFGLAPLTSKHSIDRRGRLRASRLSCVSGAAWPSFELFAVTYASSLQPLGALLFPAAATRTGHSAILISSLRDFGFPWRGLK